MKEGDEHLKQANKMLTKTITRWNPDFFSAAPLFEKVCNFACVEQTLNAHELKRTIHLI